jgi:hypothetical protein
MRPGAAPTLRRGDSIKIKQSRPVAVARRACVASSPVVRQGDAGVAQLQTSRSMLYCPRISDDRRARPST